MKDTVTLGVQAGDERAGQTTEPHFMSLRKLLASVCTGPYSTEVDEFALILRIDGIGILKVAKNYAEAKKTDISL